MNDKDVGNVWDRQFIVFTRERHLHVISCFANNCYRLRLNVARVRIAKFAIDEDSPRGRG